MYRRHCTAATSSLSNLRTRQAELNHLARTMEELNQLFQTMAIQIEQAEAQVHAVGESAQNVQGDLEGGTGELKKAVKHARSWRKYKWYTFDRRANHHHYYRGRAWLVFRRWAREAGIRSRGSAGYDKVEMALERVRPVWSEIERIRREFLRLSILLFVCWVP